MNRIFFLRTSILFLATISMFSVVGFSQAKPKVCVVMNAIHPFMPLSRLFVPQGQHSGGMSLSPIDDDLFRSSAPKGFYEMYLSYILSKPDPVEQRGGLVALNGVNDLLQQKIATRLREQGCEVSTMGSASLTDFVMKTFQQRSLPKDFQVTTITPSLVVALKKHTKADILVFVTGAKVSYNAMGQKRNDVKPPLYNATTQALLLADITAGSLFDDLRQYDYACMAEDRWSAQSGGSLLQKKTLPDLVAAAIGNAADSLASDLFGKVQFPPTIPPKQSQTICFIDNSLSLFRGFGIPEYVLSSAWEQETANGQGVTATQREMDRFGDSVFMKEYSMPLLLFRHKKVAKSPRVKDATFNYYGSNTRDVIYCRSNDLDGYVALFLASQGHSVSFYVPQMLSHLAQQTKTPYVKDRWTPGSYTPASLYKDPRIVDIDQPFLDELYRLTKADKIVVGGAVVMNFEILGNRSSDKESVSGTQWMALEYPLEIYNGNQKETKIFKGEFRNTLDKVTDGQLHRIYELYQMYGLCMEQIREQVTKVLAEI